MDPAGHATQYGADEEAVKDKAERQRVAFARMLSPHAARLFTGEPGGAGLSFKRERVMRKTKKAMMDRGLTIGGNPERDLPGPPVPADEKQTDDRHQQIADD